MTRKCVCQLCKKKGTTDNFHKVTDGQGRNKYYCNKEEYDGFIRNKEKRSLLLTFIVKSVLEYEEGQIIPPVLIKKIQTLHKFYDYEVIHECFNENLENIHYWIKHKKFENEYNMMCYIMKIIEGTINDVYVAWKFKSQRKINEESNELNVEIINDIDNVKTKNTSNGILDFLDDNDL